MDEWKPMPSKLTVAWSSTVVSWSNASYRSVAQKLYSGQALPQHLPSVDRPLMNSDVSICGELVS